MADQQGEFMAGRSSRTRGVMLIGVVVGGVFCLLGALVGVTFGVIRPAQVRILEGTATGIAQATEYEGLLDQARDVLTQAAMTPQNEWTATAAQEREDARATQTAGMERANATILPITMTAQADTAQSLPMTPPPNAGYLSFYDGFDSNSNGWPTGGVDELDWNIENGRYKWIVNAEEPRYDVMPIPSYTGVATGQILVEVYHAAEPSDAINFGIVFGLTYNGYYFAVNTLGEWSLIYGNARDGRDVIRSGTGIDVSEQPTRLGVILENETARLYINEVLVHEETDVEVDPEFGLVGLGIQVLEPIQTTVSFDDLSVFTPQP